MKEIDLGIREYLLTHTRREVWRHQLDAMLAHTDGNKARAARKLGISRVTLYKATRRRR